MDGERFIIQGKDGRFLSSVDEWTTTIADACQWTSEETAILSLGLYHYPYSEVIAIRVIKKTDRNGKLI